MPKPDLTFADPIFKLPNFFHINIGKIVTAYSYLEAYHNRVISILLGLDDIDARIALREQNLLDRLQTIETLAFLRDYSLDFDFSDYKRKLEKIVTQRNSLVHGVWVKVPYNIIPSDWHISEKDKKDISDEDGNLILLALTRGKRADQDNIKISQFKNRKVFPEAVVFSSTDFSDIYNAIVQANELMDSLCTAIEKIKI